MAFLNRDPSQRSFACDRAYGGRCRAARIAASSVTGESGNVGKRCVVLVVHREQMSGLELYALDSGEQPLNSRLQRLGSSLDPFC
eukprot:2638031-Amphidinium_carterae.1